MLGGMSGGGMGFIFAPEKRALAQRRLQELMSETKGELQHALPFAMEPVVYDFAINERGTFAELLQDSAALMPSAYYTLIVPGLLRQERQALSPLRRAELDKFGAACRTRPELRGVVQDLFDAMLPKGKTESGTEASLAALLAQHGFDPVQHEQIRADLKDGRIGLAQNRLPASAVIEDVNAEDVVSSASFQLAKVPATFQVAGPPPFPFSSFDKKKPVTIRSRNLPHWRQAGVTYFITFRLADSLPQAVAQQILRERDEFLRQQQRSLTPERIEEIKDFYREKLEAELDKGYGACVLQDQANATIVEDALRHFDGQRYWLGHFVVMPNHVHALV